MPVFERGITMKKNVLKTAVLMMLCLVLIMGCGNSYGDKVYTCSSKNMMGFKGVYADGNTVTLLFETDDASTGSPDIKISRMFDLRSDDEFFLISKDYDFAVIDTGELTEDFVNGTITFNLTGFAPEEIESIQFTCDGDRYSIDIINGEIEALVNYDDGIDLCMQVYESGKWSEIQSLSNMLK